MNTFSRVVFHSNQFAMLIFIALFTSIRGESILVSNLDQKSNNSTHLSLDGLYRVEAILTTGNSYSEINSISIHDCYDATSVSFNIGTNSFSSAGYESTSMTGERFTYGVRTFHFKSPLQLQPNTDYSFKPNRGWLLGSYSLPSTNMQGFVLKSIMSLSVDINTKSDGNNYQYNTNIISLIPSGDFIKNDSTLESVDVFAIDKYEVTLELWNEVKDWGNSHGYDLGSGKSFGPKHPVHTVSWYDTVKWCNARSEKENRIAAYYEDAAMMKVYRAGEIQPNGVKLDTGYRLPTESEWEKAARGGSVIKKFPWGTDSIDHSKARYDSSYIDGPIGTLPVGSYPSNGYGIYDMAGNIEEWCWNWYKAVGVPSEEYRVIRGGGWSSSEYFCQVWISSGRGAADSLNSNRYGFRSVLSHYQPKVPIIIQQPKEAFVRQGDTTSFIVVATNAVSYQWIKNDIALFGATNAVLTINNIQLTHSGDFAVVVSNTRGSVTSDSVKLKIICS